MIKLLIFGPTGSMGKLISKLALEDKDIDVVAACDAKNIGENLANVVGTSDPNKIKITDVKNLREVIKDTNPDIAVDFTVAAATEKNCMICAENGIRCVIGTTALSQEFLDKFEREIKQNHVPAVISPNMATGVNILFKMASTLTSYLSDWDIEVIETHHHRKVDAPSGTALRLGQILSETIGSDFEKIAKFGRQRGPSKRLAGAKNEIGIHSIRGGDIVGDHTILYAGPGERIEFKHQAHSRVCFADGSILAIKFIAVAKDDKIYTTQDVLGL
ncbi:MAG: 4-hydroxy-tetrahydrodipicolinate reductase [Candidatus Lokiarchaeota archaeon]|nr:4-hydroxy-tetrahydrodipicolinate reductase [Candidatus Lokiarchaeota archaeon]